MKQLMGWVSAGFVLSLLVSGLGMIPVHASAWTTEKVEVASRSVVDRPQQFNEVATCNGGNFGSVRYALDGIQYPACIFGADDGTRVARFFHSSRLTVYAIAYRGDAEFYHIQSACHYTCAYAPETDAYLWQSAGPYWQKHAGVYYNFAKNLHREINLETGEVYYQFDPPEPPKMVMLGTVQAFVEASAFSENGEWLVVEVRSLGILRIHVATMEMRRVVAPGSEYGYGNDPRVELAISNDGAQLVITGMRKGLSVYTIDDTCGDRVSGQMYASFGSNTAQCHLADLDYYALFPGFSYAMYPSFNQDGSRLRVIVITANGTFTRAVLIPGARPATKAYEYLALGDSFTSGEGETDTAAYLPYTDSPPHSCHVSRRAYPNLLIAQWGITGSSVACSGATTADLFGTGAYTGQGGRLSGLTVVQKEALRSSALATMRQGIIHQARFVETYQPEVVTLGIGGNDAGLIDKLKTCLGLTTCEWAEDPTLRRAAAEEIVAIGTRLRATIRNLEAASPETAIVLVGYPEIINPDTSCGGLVGRMLNTQERVFMRHAITLLNKVVAYAAAAEGVHFVAVQDAYKGFMLCDPSPIAMNGVRGGDDIAPVGALPLLKMVGAESFHPTPYGHAAVARKIVSQFSASQAKNPCRCTVNVGPPVLSGYWGQGERGEDDLRLFRQDTIARRVAPGTTIAVTAKAGTFEPNSVVRFELHSKLSNLGEAFALDDGSLSAEVTIPADSSEGYHTLYAFGRNRSHQSIAVYESIAVGEEDIASEAPLLDTTASSTPTPHISTKASLAPPVSNHGSDSIDSLRSPAAILGTTAVELMPLGNKERVAAVEAIIPPAWLGSIAVVTCVSVLIGWFILKRRRGRREEK